MSELRGIQQNIDKFTAAGVTPVAISVDPPATSHDLAERYGLTFPILSDPNLETIRRYDLVHEGEGEDGKGIARPAEFLIDSNGAVRWLNLTENYWFRANPDEMIEKAKALP
ncbi:MAG: redoxin domain-containing protein [Pyrinomonadaceae bacterium]